MIKLTSRFTNAGTFFTIYKLLKHKQFLINLGSLGVLFVNKFPMFEVSIVALGDDISDEFFLVSQDKIPEAPKKRKKKKVNEGLKESGETGLFDGLTDGE